MMILENEMTAGGVYAKVIMMTTAQAGHTWPVPFFQSSSYSYALKSLIVLSTVILLLLILSYHAIDIQVSPERAIVPKTLHPAADPFFSFS